MSSSSTAARSSRPTMIPAFPARMAGSSWPDTVTAAPSARPGRADELASGAARGEDAPTIINWTIDTTHYRAVPTMSDGRAGAPLELRGLFKQFLLETQGME